MVNRPEWLAPEAARAIAAAAGAVLGRRRLPAIPASADAGRGGGRGSRNAPQPPPPGHEPASLVPAEPGRLAQRLGFLASGADRPSGTMLGALARRLANGGAARIGGGAGEA